MALPFKKNHRAPQYEYMSTKCTEDNFKILSYVMLCCRVPAANAPGCTAAEGLLHKPWSLVISTCTARCLHQRP